ncbi:hypothetical protein CYMTET_26378 [Cymbomonas tetramitiformis]|uniref:Uncharacterized protein n=1 Tax=Cymbomonas tetramitiformis TaxID=36881 RepID=A0AAE0FS86_9CHLO|nr:hypothetical protein CYMTET_26378 [Cymbomonas tetramitiformis]
MARVTGGQGVLIAGVTGGRGANGKGDGRRGVLIGPGDGGVVTRGKTCHGGIRGERANRSGDWRAWRANGRVFETLCTRSKYHKFRSESLEMLRRAGYTTVADFAFLKVVGWIDGDQFPRFLNLQHPPDLHMWRRVRDVVIELSNFMDVTRHDIHFALVQGLDLMLCIITIYKSLFRSTTSSTGMSSTVEMVFIGMWVGDMILLTSIVIMVTLIISHSNSLQKVMALSPVPELRTVPV